jgi:hypothetical protein
MLADAWELGQLPGARRFFAKVNRAIDDGRSVFIVVPESSVESGLAARIRDGVTAARCVHVALDREVLLRHQGSIPAAAAVAADFLDPLDTDDHVDRWQAYLRHDEARGRSVLVAGWDIDLTDDVSYWLRLVHASALHPDERPTFVFLVRESDVDVGSLEKEHSPNLTVLWWWGAIGLIDSELCADLALGGDEITPLRRAMLSECVGWELELAGGCARTWGSADSPTVLAKAMIDQVRGPIFSLNADELHAVENARVRDRPPAKLLNAWNRGEVNAWEGQVFVSARYRDFADIVDRRFWHAQARILMPFFERQRLRMAKRFEKLATPRQITETAGESGLLELGRMLSAHRKRHVAFGPEDETLLRMLVLARNKIAHHECLNDEAYAAIAELCS